MENSQNTATPQSLEEWRKKLRFRSWHRGTREMDLLMGSFADDNVETFGAPELALYEEILMTNDPDIYDFVCKRKDVPANLQSPVMERLLAHKFVKA
jgi:antitoxin CptB